MIEFVKKKLQSLGKLENEPTNQSSSLETTPPDPI